LPRPPDGAHCGAPARARRAGRRRRSAIIERVPGELWTVHLGVVEYREAHDLQERLRAARQAGAIPDTLLLLEHPPVYTRGRRSAPGELGMGEHWYRAQGIDIVDVDRGGKVTYHGPGQLVGYPIVAVDEVMAYVATLEHAIAAALDDEGIAARGRSHEGIAWTGVWVQDRKLASIGLHVSQGVAKHGFAVNVDNALDPFEWIVPCGLPDVRMTSVARESPGDGPHMACFRKRMAWRFAQVHGSRQRLVSRARLEAALDGVPAGHGSALSLAR
jgi:lipoyl(octanoyl) transferase